MQCIQIYTLMYWLLIDDVYVMCAINCAFWLVWSASTSPNKDSEGYRWKLCSLSFLDAPKGIAAYTLRHWNSNITLRFNSARLLFHEERLLCEKEWKKKNWMMIIVCEMKDTKRNFKNVRRLETNGEVRSSQQLCSNDDAFSDCDSMRG